MEKKDMNDNLEQYNPKHLRQIDGEHSYFTYITNFPKKRHKFKLERSGLKKIIIAGSLIFALSAGTMAYSTACQNDANEAIYIEYPFSDNKTMSEYKLVVVKNGTGFFENEEGKKCAFVNDISAQDMANTLIDNGIITLEKPYHSQTDNYNKRKH